MCSNNHSSIQDLRCQAFLRRVNKHSAIVLHYFAKVRLWHFEFIAWRFQLYATANLYPDELFALLFTPVASWQKWQRWIMLPVFNNKIPVFRMNNATLSAVPPEVGSAKPDKSNHDKNWHFLNQDGNWPSGKAYQILKTIAVFSEFRFPWGKNNVFSAILMPTIRKLTAYSREKQNRRNKTGYRIKEVKWTFTTKYWRTKTVHPDKLWDVRNIIISGILKLF